jgi:uncharacterized membrane protein YobD (UPF0266 family)
MEDCSTVGLDISSGFIGLVTVSVVGFFFDCFFKRSRSVFHESGVIKPNMFIEFNENNKKENILTSLRTWT